MLTFLASKLLGHAAKAGMGLLGGALAGVGSVASVDLSTPEAEMSILGYIVVGTATGFINWALVYFKANT